MVVTIQTLSQPVGQTGGDKNYFVCALRHKYCVMEKSSAEMRKNMNNDRTDIKDVIFESVPEERDDKYNDYVDENTPKVSWMVNLCKAFLVGGIICVLGQALTSLYMYLGVDKETAALYNTLSLIFLSVVLTGMNIYPKIANFAGAGTLVPITGFANSVAAPAIEFKKEGWVFGVGCKIFTIAGPVILYGVVTSWVLGLVYWIGKLIGWF